MKKYLLFLFALTMICGYSFGQTYLTESFEGAWSGTLPAPSGWTQTHPTGTDSETWEKSVWTTVWTPSGSGTKPTGTAYGTAVAHFNDFNSAAGNVFRIESGDINLSTSTNPRVTFYYFYNLGSAVLRIWASNNGGSTWTNISGSIAATGSSWTKFQYNMSGYKVSNARIALEVTSAYSSHDLWVDNVVVEETPVPLAGSYTIDPAGSGSTNFPTFTAAINAINDAGISATLTFNVAPGAVFTEDCPSLTATGTSGSQIIFQKATSGVNPVIKPTGGTGTTDAGIKIAGGDYITFDGIDIAIATGSAVEYGYYIYNTSATNGAQNNTIKNSKITLNRANTSSTGIYQYTAVTPTNQVTGNNNSNKYYNLTIENVYRGIYLSGGSATYFDSGCEIGVISGGTSTIGASSANDIGYGSSTTWGVRAAYQSDCKIFGLEIRNITVTSSVNANGIYMDNVRGTCSVYNNNIHDIKTTSTSTSSILYGIRVDVASGNSVNVYNNFVSGFSHGITTASTTVVARGIGANIAATTGIVNLYYNSVRIELGAAATSSALFTQSGTTNAMNNIFSNFSTAGATSKRYCIYLSSGTLSKSNYNDLYIFSGTNNFVGYNLADKATLSDWQTSFTPNRDINSKNVNPGFSTPTNLHSSSSGLNGAGISVSITNGDALDITTDIDGVTRGTPPDIGADEFTLNDQTSRAEAPATQVSSAGISSTSTTIGEAVDVFRFKITDMGSGDGLATKVTNIRIQNANPANGASWTTNIAGLKLNDGSGDILIGAPTITASYIDIPITSGNLDVADASSKTITMSIYLKTSGIEDGKKLQFTISQTGHNWFANGSGSLFADDFSAAVSSNEHTISVSATKLVLSGVPASVLVNNSFSATVTAADANGNTDTDIVSSVTLSKNAGTGTLSSTSGLTQLLINGTKTWNDLAYDRIEIFTIQADDGLLTQAVSGNIDCGNTVIIGTSTVSSQSYPFDVYFGYSRNAALYTRSEIGAFFPLTKISWQIALAQITSCPIKVYLKKTTAASITADTWENMISGATLVYDGTVQFTPTGWYDIVFSASFNYDAVNLLVLTEGNYTLGGTSTYPTFYYTTAVNMNASQRVDNTPPTTALTVGSSRPNIKLTMPVPKSLAGITYNQASSSSVTFGGLNQEILRLDFAVTGTSSSMNLNSIVVTSNNTNDADISAVKLFRTTTPVFNTTNQLGSSQVFSGGTASFSSLNYDLPGDVTTYLWIAYDISGSATELNLADAKITANSIDVAGTTYPLTNQDPLGSRTIRGPLHDTYTIGTGGDYPTITSAVSDLYALGVSNAVTFSLINPLYSTSETFPVTINVFPGGSATNTLTIKPGPGNTAVITGAQASGPIFKILSGNVIIDGSNLPGGISRDLTLTNTSLTAPNVVLIGSTGTTPIAGVTVKNAILINGANTSTALVVSDGATLGSAGYFNNITIQNNSIQKSYVGIYCIATVVGGNGSILITENDLSSSGTNSISYIGIYLQGVDGAIVSKNTIGNFDGTGSQDDKGIWFATGTVNSVVEKNNIFNLNYTGTGGYGTHGIAVSTGVTGSNNTLRNNMISNISGDGYGYTGTYWLDNPYGIVLYSTQTGVKVFNNSVHLYGNSLNQTGALSAGIAIGTGSTADVRNNIFVNNLGLMSATGTGSTGIFLQAADTQLEMSDYNDIWTNPGGSGLKYVVLVGTTGYTSLIPWQAAASKDLMSISGDPKFVAPTDLHINTTAISPVNNTGVELESVLTDIDGDLRNNPPDIGADEFSRTAPKTVAPTLLAVPGYPVVIPVKVYGFNNIGTISLTLDYNPTVLTFQGMVSTTIPSPSWTVDYNASSGRFVIGGYGPGFSLPDGSVLFNLTFMYNGGTSNLSWYDADGSSCEYSDATTHDALYDLPQPTYYVDGAVSEGKGLFLSLFLEGLYDGEGLMRKAQNGNGDQFQADTAEVINVELHNQGAYNDPPVYIANSVKLTPTGQAIVVLPTTYNDSYYVTIKHRNSVETTTVIPVLFSGSVISYAFDDPSKAFGSNMGVFIDGATAIYAADENQDGIVDGTDLADIENLVPTAPSGYIKEDINGDGLIDGSDLSIAGNNAASAISVILP